MSHGPESVGPAAGGDSSALEDAVRRFVRAWRQGARPAIDDYLPRQAGPRHALLVELAHTELEFRLKGGEPARVEDYLARHPELAGDVDHARVLRSVLMKPEHQAWVPRLHRDVCRIARRSVAEAGAGSG
jgi:hypothetical protein